MKNANWIVALIVGAAIGFVVGQAVNRPGASTNGSVAMAGGDRGKSPNDLPSGYLKEADLPSGLLTGLSDQQKYSVLKAINEKPCTCGCSNDTIAKCRKNDPTCTTSPKLIDQAIALARQGKSAMEIEAAFGGPSKGGNAPPADDSNVVYRANVGHSPARGPADAKVTIVEWSDFQCPFCGRVEPTLKQLVDKYGDQLRIVWRNQPLPFHPNAMPAAKAAMAAYAQGNDKFWKMHDLLFENQRELSPANYEKWAQASGVDMAKWKADMASPAVDAEIQADMREGSALGASGTPAFFINGKKLVGAQPLEAFEKVVDAEIQHATDLVSHGVRPDQLYAEIMKNARTSPPPAQQAKNDARPASQVRKVEVGDGWVKGAKDAKVTIVEFSDFQCPFCGRVEPTLKQIEQTYGKDVRLVWRHEPLPFHPNAMPAAEAAEAAGAQGKFWQMHDLLFQGQRDLSPANYEKWAEQLGLNMGKFKADVAANRFKDKIDADNKYAQSVGASGTPNFFIDGRQLVGAQPFEQFKSIIDEEIKKADALLKKGVQPAKLYETELEENLKAQPQAPAAGGPPSPAERKTVSVGDAPVLGSSRAPVTIVEWSDFQCPFCSRVEPTIKQIEQDYPGKVKVVWKNQPLPFHPNAMPAAKAAMAAKEQGKFWEMHDLLFQNQRDLGEASYEKWAQQLGLNMDKFKADMASQKIADEIQADMKEGAALGANGTPNFFIDGRQLVGAQPVDQFKAIIDDELKGAQKPVAAKAMHRRNG